MLSTNTARISCADSSTKPIGGIVGPLENLKHINEGHFDDAESDLGLVFELEDAHDGPKDLLAADFHVVLS